jgi:conjugal transfer mating pair stabilization protein TraN
MQSLNAIEDDHTIDPLVIFTGNSLACRRTFASGITRDCCTLDTLLLGCNSSEELLQTRRNEGQCVQIGTYCSQEVDLLFTTVCVERTTSFCCFSSKLTRIIQEQGRAQLGIGWGSAENPDCRGFTPEELQAINFEAIDFSECYADITANPPDPASLSSQAQGSQALTPDPNSVPPPPSGISQGQVQEDINQFYGTHAP